MATSQGRQHQKPPPPKVGRGVKQTLPRASRRSHPCPHRDSSLPALRTEREDIPATSLSHQACSALVVAALGNEHTYPPIFSFIFFCSLAIAFYKWKVNPQSGKKKKRNKTGTQHLCLLYDIVTWKTLITQNPNLPMFLSVWLHLGSVFASFTTESHLLSFSFTWWPILPSQFVPPFIMGSAHSQSHVPSPPFFFKCIWLSQLWHTGSLVAAFGIQFPNQGSNPGTLHWKHRVLTSGPPEKSLPPPS